MANETDPKDDRERGRASRAALLLAALSVCAATASLVPRDQGGFLPAALLFVVLTAAFLRRSAVPGSRRPA